MRGTRWLILLAITAILGGVGLTYRLQKSALERQAPARPKALPLDLSASAEDYVWTQTVAGRLLVELRARKFGQARDKSYADLEHVVLKLLHKETGDYDLVKSEKARFSVGDRTLYSEGDVEITLGVNGAAQAGPKLVSIRSSGVTFDSNTGKASTDRPASFVFDKGSGSSVGASYDPMAKELHMKSQVVLHWNAAGPRAKPMKVEAGDVTYKEAESKIWLLPWARLTRGPTLLETAAAVVTLVDGDIRRIESVKAHGTDRYPGRTLEYTANELWADFAETGEVSKITGFSGARLLSTSETAATTVTSDRVEMEFTETGGESTLSRTLAHGKAVLEAKPVPAAGRPVAETRVLRSEIVEVKMRPGGREIDTVETQAPGTLEFLPNRPAQRHRTLTGERFSIAYAARNQIRRFQATNVETRTEPAEQERASKRATAVTRSKALEANFNPDTGQLAKLEQWDDFSYEEGARHARAVHATLEQASETVLLEKAARMWDAAGSTSADRIQLDQRSGDFTASGHVNSTRQTESKKGGSEMLAGDEPLHALAAKMTSANRNRRIVYDGDAVLWQGASRIQADRVEIDRDRRTLVAAGNVVTQFLEQPPPGSPAPGSRPPAPVFTVVRAARLLYTESSRLARYTGGARMTRPGLDVKAAEIRAILAEQGSASRVEKAYADGAVEIFQASPGRTRTGTGNHAEYYSGEEKLILNGGDPKLVDSLRGEVRGAELTYYANDDRLLVNGAPGQPAKSRIRRK